MGEVLFIKPANSSFIRKDEAFLARNYITSVFYFKSGAFGRLLLSEIALTFWLLRHIRSSKLIFIWFADYHSLIPALLAKLLKKRCAIVIGGYDAAKVPELNYGAHLRRFRSFCTSTSCDLADVILPVSVFTKRDILRFCHNRRCRVIYNGVNPLFFKMMGKKENLILTVCGADDVRTVLRKGVDFFAEIARKIPDQGFVVVGMTGKARQFLEEKRIPNLRIIGRLTHEELLTYYQKARIYCQLSAYEAFGLTLAEAMLCECIPVGSNDGATPEVIGDVGFIVESRCAAEVVKTIRRALSCGEELGRLARQRMIENFSMCRREYALREIFDEMLCGPPMRPWHMGASRRIEPSSSSDKKSPEATSA